MIALLYESALRYRGRSAALHATAIFGLVWGVFAFAGSGAEVGANDSDRDLPAYGPVAVAPVFIGPSPLPRGESEPPSQAAVLPRHTGGTAEQPSLRRPTAERPDPPPALFERVSYRTTGPPIRNG